MAANIASCEFIYLCKLIAKLTCEMLAPILVYCDKQSCIKLFENPYSMTALGRLLSGTTFFGIGFRSRQWLFEYV
jgi:hypothetical protein